MLQNFILVAIGGALGSVARYGLTLVWKSTPSAAGNNLPWGTLSANVLGCFLIGLFTEWAGSKLGMSPETRLLLTTGFCGGFTTLSSLLLETNDLFRNSDGGLGLLYLALSLVLPFLALWAGIALVAVLEKFWA